SLRSKSVPGSVEARAPAVRPSTVNGTTRRGFLVTSAAALAAFAGCRGATDLARLPPPPAPIRVAWDPRKTWAFFVGVLSFDDPSFGSFPTEGRVDAELVETLRSRGVPDEQIVFLVDGEATKANIESQLAAHLRKAAPGDMLLLYYAGHGHREPDGATYFIPRDVDGTSVTTSGWAITSIYDAIEQHFRGATALLTADCCYSGRLTVEAARQKGPVAFATLASSDERETSTDAWTFSECLRDALRGKPVVDRDRDSVITLDELGAWVEDEMPFKEGQLASFARGKGFPRDLALTQRVPSAKPRVGEHVEVRRDEEWQRATIADVKDGRLRVLFVGATPGSGDDDEWVLPAQVRPWKPSQLPVGAVVEVLDEGQWYPATILDAKLGVHFVHYVDWPDSDDEWVGPDEVRVPGAATTGQTERL
ncbi:MAG: caspase family protein, partial [Polyangiales bacterium]